MRTFLLSTIFFLFCTQPQSHASDSNLPTGLLKLNPRQAPEIRLHDIDGNPYSLADDRGKLVFIHFWASWCGPCRKEMPSIQRMWNILKAEGLRIALINTAEDEDTVFTFLAAHAPDIRALMDRDGQTTEKWSPRGLPATYIVSADGQILYQALGGRPWDSKAYLNFLQRLMRAN